MEKRVAGLQKEIISYKEEIVLRLRDRITSYNVCYTKLLRDVVERSHHHPVHDEGDGQCLGGQGARPFAANMP